MMLNSEELSKKLGFDNYKGLCDLLSKQLSKLFQFDVASKHIIYKNDVIELPKPTKEYLQRSYDRIRKEGICKLPIVSNDKIKGWKVLLSPNNKKICKKKDLIRYNNEIIPQNIMLHDKLDHSHLLANMFENNLCADIESLPHQNGTFTNFFSKKNENNIVPLFKNVNEGKSKYHTQVWYENQIYHLLDGNNEYKLKYSVYYEVQAVYAEKYDKMPIGIRILYYKLENEKISNNIIHIFIPNYYNGELKPLAFKGYRNMFKELNLH